MTEYRTFKDLKGIDHKIFKCPIFCQIADCPLKGPQSEHFPKHCPYVKANFATILAKASVCQQSITNNLPHRHLSNLASVSLPAWLGAPKIQYDSGANILASPTPPFQGEVFMSKDSIDIADGTQISIEGISNLGTSKCFINDTFSTCLVPQTFLDTSGVAALLYNKNLHLIDIKQPSNLVLLENLPVIQRIQSENDLYFFSQSQLYDLAQRQLSPINKSSALSSTTVRNSSTCIAKYHTIDFRTKSDLVLYWHTTLGHISKRKMISIVKNKLIDNLPTELTNEL